MCDEAGRYSVSAEPLEAGPVIEAEAGIEAEPAAQPAEDLEDALRIARELLSGSGQEPQAGPDAEAVQEQAEFGAGYRRGAGGPAGFGYRGAMEGE
jgi:hypothetical protein